jgi:hypothetical protein
MKQISNYIFQGVPVSDAAHLRGVSRMLRPVVVLDSSIAMGYLLTSIVAVGLAFAAHLTQLSIAESVM